jgi:acyl dehydratase
MLQSHKSLEVGSAPTPFVDAPLTRTDFVRYQGASGDMNPIHHDDDFARRAGYPSVFAPGMFAAGVLGMFLTEWLGPANVRRIKVRFREQAWPGDVLTYTAHVTQIREEDGKRYADIEGACTRQNGGVHVSGWATFELDS